MRLGLAKLLESGLTLKDSKALGLKFLEGPETAKLHHTFQALPSIYIPYWNPHDPEEPLAAWPEWPQFFRLRYLDQSNDFSQLTDAKPQRYTQAPDTGLCAYFPPILEDWPEILDDATQPLIVTEGEFKAAKACLDGYPTVGLGGVYSFRSAKMGVTFLNELEEVNWVKRPVYVIYDSDFRSNVQVCQAINAIAHELMQRGAQPYVVGLPDVVEDGKTGLDDYLVSDNADLDTLIEHRAQPITLASNLWKLNEEVLYVYNPGLVMVQETDQKINPGAFKEHAYSKHDHAEAVMKDGQVSLRPASAAEAWLRWPLRREAGALTYAPGKPRFIEHPSGSVKRSRWNIWPGWGVEPKRGDISPFLQLVEHIFEGATKATKKWFLQWCAFPLQYPGTKMFSSVVVYGIRHGTGKSLIGYTLGRIYGSNFAEISQADLHSAFNEWAEGKQFVLGDDVTGSDKRQDADLLKKLITQKELRVNPKYVPSYVVPDCINYYFTSNQPDAFFLEDDDRRFFIHEVHVAPLPEDFYVEYGLWLESGGASYLFHYLMNIDIESFNPAAPALRTSAKEQMIADVKSDLGSWVYTLKTDPDSALRVGQVEIPGDLFSAKDLLHIYDPMEKTRTTANGMARELRRAGIPVACKGMPVRTKAGSTRFYVVRNRGQWESAPPSKATKHIEEIRREREAKY